MRGNPTAEDLEALEAAIAILIARGPAAPAAPDTGRPRLLRRPPAVSRTPWRMSTWSG
ncbi:hypothetical protein Plo01_18750 [Planobispora longispora]|uniref:Uncharacterized protein n=1 Tax=Planobispora longispora TaxID=28887 RepID=A0A8J3RFR7_9ACTN|nr:hypothetical protein Plo01_18750 [Planobispora longispora]